jgi:nanoRNase/pAp phosphatase (c-di-AMP/oligoRNAs hydrolase)
MERLEHVTRALATSRLQNQILSAFVGETTREDFIPYTADFLLQLEDVRWAIVSGIVGGQLIISVRNLGYSRNAGEFVKGQFGDIGSAGGHRALAKAVVPADRFFGKFGHLSGVGIAARIGELAEQFLNEQTTDKKAASPAKH